jgi:hypothetical protein
LIDNNRETSGLTDISWENLGFNPVKTDFMYVMKCSEDGEFLAGGLQPFGNIELNPASCVLNYGQVIYSNACTFWASFSAGFIDPFFIQIDLFFFMIKGCHWCFQNFMYSSALADLLCYCCFLI